MWVTSEYIIQETLTSTGQDMSQPSVNCFTRRGSHLTCPHNAIMTSYHNKLSRCHWISSLSYLVLKKLISWYNYVEITAFRHYHKLQKHHASAYRVCRMCPDTLCFINSKFWFFGSHFSSWYFETEFSCVNLKKSLVTFWFLEFVWWIQIFIYDRIFNNFSPFQRTENKILWMRTLRKFATYSYEKH